MVQNLRDLREQKKLSVAALANRAGLPIGLIMEYESGQRSIDPRHLSRLARALYVDEAEVKLRSDPRPSPAPTERQARPEPTTPPLTSAPGPDVLARPSSRPRERTPRPRAEPKPPVPARPSQLAHLQTLLTKLHKTQAELEAEIGKPVAELDRIAMSGVLKDLQEQIRGRTVERHRAYLPESVDAFEAQYLTAAREAGGVLRFALFDGQSVEGQVIGFGPYSITIRTADAAECTINKLAIVSYTKAASPDGQKKASP